MRPMRVKIKTTGLLFTDEDEASDGLGSGPEWGFYRGRVPRKHLTERPSALTHWKGITL